MVVPYAVLNPFLKRTSSIKTLTAETQTGLTFIADVMGLVQNYWGGGAFWTYVQLDNDLRLWAAVTTKNTKQCNEMEQSNHTCYSSDL